jgi:hypothetical protein
MTWNGDYIFLQEVRMGLFVEMKLNLMDEKIKENMTRKTTNLSTVARIKMNEKGFKNGSKEI